MKYMYIVYVYIFWIYIIVFEMVLRIYDYIKYEEVYKKIIRYFL